MSIKIFLEGWEPPPQPGYLVPREAIAPVTDIYFYIYWLLTCPPAICPANKVLDSDYVFQGLLLLLAWWVWNKYQATGGSYIKFIHVWQWTEDLSSQLDRVDVVKVKAHGKRENILMGEGEAII